MVDGVASLEQQAAVSRHPNNDYNQLFCSPKGSLSRTGLFFIPVRISVRLCVCTWGEGGGVPVWQALEGLNGVSYFSFSRLCFCNISFKKNIFPCLSIEEQR